MWYTSTCSVYTSFYIMYTLVENNEIFLYKLIEVFFYSEKHEKIHAEVLICIELCYMLV